MESLASSSQGDDDMTTNDFTTTATYVGSRMGETGTLDHTTGLYDSKSRFVVLAVDSDAAAMSTAKSVAAWDHTWWAIPSPTVGGGAEVWSTDGLEALVTAEEAPQREVATGTFDTTSGVTSSPLFGARRTWARQIKAWYPSVAQVAIKGHTVQAIHPGAKFGITLGFVTDHAPKA